MEMGRGVSIRGEDQRVSLPKRGREAAEGPSGPACDPAAHKRVFANALCTSPICDMIPPIDSVKRTKTEDDGMTVLLVAVMTVLFSLQSLFCKLYSQKSDGGSTAMTSTVFSITYGAFAGLVTLAVAGFRFSPSVQTLMCGLLNAVMLLIYNTAMIQASRTGSYSFQMICALFGGIVLPMLHEMLFLGGSLTVVQFSAIAVMLFSFVLLNLKGLSLKGSSGRFLFWCAALFVSNGVYSILMNWQQQLMHGTERNEMIILTYLVMALLYAVSQAVRNRHALIQGFRMGRGKWTYLLLCCVCATLAAHLMLYLLTQVDAAVLYTIDNGGVLLLSVVYSCVLFKEKLSLPQGIGVVLAMASMIALSI